MTDPTDEDRVEAEPLDLGEDAFDPLDDEALLLDEDFIQRILDGEDDVELPKDFFLDGGEEFDPLVDLGAEEEPDAGEEEEQSEEARLAEKTIAELERKDEEDKEQRLSLYARVKEMPVGQKIKLALKGGRDARNILIHESNKVVKRLVLRNPRISEDEIIMLAHNRSEESELLEFVAKRKEWMKSYRVRLALVSNPKTPATVALRAVNTLLDRDLRALAKSKNVPALVNSAAKRLLFKRQGH